MRRLTLLCVYQMFGGPGFHHVLSGAGWKCQWLPHRYTGGGSRGLVLTTYSDIFDGFEVDGERCGEVLLGVVGFYIRL